MPSVKQSDRLSDEPARAENTVKEKPRTWLLAAVIIGGCLCVVLLYFYRPRTEGMAVAAPDSNTRLQEPNRVTETIGRVESNTVNNLPQNPKLAGDEETSVVNLAKFWELEPAMRGAYLINADPTVVTGMLDVLTGEEKNTALEALQETFEDRATPGRLQALQLLLSWSKLDEDTVMNVFGTAINDPDSSFGNVAVSMLSSREDAQAASVLAKAYAAGDPTARLTIIQAIGPESPASPVLQAARSDPDEMVRSTANSILSPQPDDLLQRVE